MEHKLRKVELTPKALSRPQKQEHDSCDRRAGDVPRPGLAEQFDHVAENMVCPKKSIQVGDVTR